MIAGCFGTAGLAFLVAGLGLLRAVLVRALSRCCAPYCGPVDEGARSGNYINGCALHCSVSGQLGAATAAESEKGPVVRNACPAASALEASDENNDKYWCVRLSHSLHELSQLYIYINLYTPTRMRMNTYTRIDTIEYTYDRIAK